MVNKGGFSFVAMLVINPIVILFYQQCSMSPLSYAKTSTPPTAVTRQIASQSKPIVVEAKKSVCAEKNENKADCAKTE
ncbi:MAG: hypothetical protein ACXVCP_05855 [Bdellovibrio sp.]